MTPFSLLAVLAWIAFCLMIVMFSVMPVGDDFRLYYSNAVQTIAAILSAIACYSTMAAYPRGSPLRKVWGFLGSGILAWGIGAILFSSYPILNNDAETPYPWYSDIGYLSLVPLIVSALLIFKHTLGFASPSWGKWAAGVLFLGALTIALWANWSGLFEEGVILPLVSAAYTLFDPILLAVTILTASTLRRGVVGQVWWYVLGGLLLYYMGNQLYSYLVLTEQYATGSPIDLFWPLGFGLIALAATMTRNMLRES